MNGHGLRITAGSDASLSHEHATMQRSIPSDRRPCAARRIPLAVVLLLAVASAGPALAQALTPAFTYQGELRLASGPATGSYDLQFRLFGAATDGSQIGATVSANAVAVSGGLFSVPLNFGPAQFAGDRQWLEIAIRPAGGGAFETLAPRTEVTAAPYAWGAAVALANAVTTTSIVDGAVAAADIAPGAVGAAQVNPAQVQRRVAGSCGAAQGVQAIAQDGSVVCASFAGGGGTVTSVASGAGLAGGPITGSGTLSIANGGVVAAMIAAGAVDSARIADDAVAAADIGADAVGASELANAAVDTAAIVDASVTTAKIASGAVGAAQVDPAQVQLRITGTCGPGEYFRGINADGSLACELLPVAFSRATDSVGSVGSFVALALRDDQRPLIAYYDATNTSLRLYDCADATCASGTRRTLDSLGDVGANVALAIRPNGLPVVAYRSTTAASLKLYDCGNAACSTGTARTLDAAVDVGAALALAVRADGRPFLAYRDDTNFRLRVYDCDTPACAGGTAVGHAGTDVPHGVSIAIRGDGRPLVALGGNAGSGARVRTFDCTDAACTSGTLRNLTTTSFSAAVAITLRGNGRPLVATAGVGSALGVHDCADAACATSTRVGFASGASNALGLVLRGDGRALIAHGINLAAGASDLRVFDCTDASCTAGSSRTAAGGGDFGGAVAIALRGDGRPVIAYHDATNADLRLHVCANPDCS